MGSSVEIRLGNSSHCKLIQNQAAKDDSSGQFSEKVNIACDFCGYTHVDVAVKCHAVLFLKLVYCNDIVFSDNSRVGISEYLVIQDIPLPRIFV